MGHGWEVVERYILGQKSYGKVDNVSVIAEEDENLERAKPGTYRSITNFLEGSIKNKKTPQPKLAISPDYSRLNRRRPHL